MAGVPVEVVPGVSSAIAAPALAGIPVTHRGLASGFAVVSGHAESAYRPMLEAITPNSLTVIVLMGIASRADLAALLLDRGWKPSTPAAAVLGAATPQAHTWRGTLGELGAAPVETFPDVPGTIVIGDVRVAELDHRREPGHSASGRGRRPRPRAGAWRRGVMMLTRKMTWKERLADRIPADLAREIDSFESQVTLKRQGKLDNKVFAETRLRRGVYGQRYDSGQRHDGKSVQELRFPAEGLTKGPDTLWDAPGMQRIKIPFGGLNPDQMDVLADLAEEYADEICHVTTRQDFQLHYVHIDDTPTLMRRLAAVGITTREACGNSVRNVTACPIAGVCHDETFDVTPYAKACMRFLLGHPDCQDFGRKFKVAFSGCQHHACGLVTMHDLGAVAVKKMENGSERRGFALHVGGGLGAVPHQAKLFDAFLPEAELLPVAQAIARVFARLGEKRNRARARIKFLVSQLGIEEFRRLVLEERAKLPHDDRWTAYLAELPAYGEKPLKPGAPLDGGGKASGVR